MANPRQRRKTKSSAHKAISHSKRAKRLLKKMPTICGPKALQDAWDPSKTLRQNYLALGLEHDLNPISSGGSEVPIGRTIDQTNATQSHPTTTDDTTPSVSEGYSATSTLTKGFGRIIRDSSGNVVRVELPHDENAKNGSNRELVVDAPVITTESELRVWACDRPAVPVRQGSGVIVQDLENIAACATVLERHTSLGERLYLERLVEKYGDDLEKMARDRRFNPIQRTGSELRRAIAKAGGFGALCKSTDANVPG